MLKYYKNNLFDIVMEVLLYIFHTGLFLIVPLITKYLIDNVFITKNYSLLKRWIIFFILVKLGVIIFGYLKSYFANKLHYSLINYLKSNLLNSVLRSMYRFTKDKSTGYLTKRIQGDVDNVSLLFLSFPLVILKHISVVIISLVILIELNLSFTLYFLILLPLFFYSLKGFNKGMREKSQEKKESMAEESSFLTEV